MTDGDRCRRNRRIREVLYPEIEALPGGTEIIVAELVKRYTTKSRHVSPGTMGNLLRELQPDTVMRVSSGVWRKVTA